MVSDHPSSMAKETNVAADKPVDGLVIVNYTSFHA